MLFYQDLEKALISSDVTFKEQIISKALAYCSKAEPKASIDFKPKLFSKPSYAKVCKIVAPKDLPKRGAFHTKEGLATLIHAILHIEYSAIDLAIDAVYRFHTMPLKYKIDWLEVASDEVRHFFILKEILNSLGFEYGDFAVHSGLFDASIHTSSDILERMAIIPRHYEATGLDVNPQIINKLKAHKKNPTILKTLRALDIIYKEEIIHVKKGDFWFKWICNERGLEPEQTFKEILKRFNFSPKRGAINVKARKEAGFSCKELLELGAKECNG